MHCFFHPWHNTAATKFPHGRLGHVAEIRALNDNWLQRDGLLLFSFYIQTGKEAFLWPCEPNGVVQSAFQECCLKLLFLTREQQLNSHSSPRHSGAASERGAGCSAWLPPRLPAAPAHSTAHRDAYLKVKRSSHLPEDAPCQPTNRAG